VIASDNKKVALMQLPNSKRDRTGESMEFLTIALSGFLATTAMIAVMTLIHKMKWANADMVRAVGSMITGAYENSFFIGLMAHYLIGIGFSFIYTLLISSAPVQSPGSTEIIAGLAGLVHGLMVGLLLMVEVAEHHPIDRFQRAGLGVAVSHVLGHIIYGLTVGFMLAHRWESTSKILTAISEDRFNAGDVIGFAVIAAPIFGAPLLFGVYMSYGFIKSKYLADIRQEKLVELNQGAKKTQESNPSRDSKSTDKAA
jgi:hypothetical protein